MSGKKKNKKKKAEVKLIDLLHEALKDSEYEVERDGWTENSHSDPPHDKCEWLDIKLLDPKGNQIVVHLYFSHDTTKLSEVAVFKAKKKIKFGMPKGIGRKDWNDLDEKNKLQINLKA